ncbi:MAG TPA: iron-containing alcohol dehydrogenase [Steroidobacteraceae bacterium]|jgi:maleylacetate reductase
MGNVENSGWSTSSPQQTVAFGVPIAEAIVEGVRRLSMSRVAVVTTNSLSGPGGLAEAVVKVLGSKFQSIVSGIHPHTPRKDVIRVAKALDGIDGVVTIGGGSVCDSVKAARLCLANGISDAVGMDRLRPYHNRNSEPDETRSPTLPFIAVPTTLSAGEFSSAAGVTDERGPLKQVFVYPRLSPDIVILDPEMTTQTPNRLFFSTGLRAVDHAVETWCSINPTPLSDAYSLHAARLLIPSLRRVLDVPADMEARLDCMKGAWLSILGAAAGVKAGASHGMGHALGGTAGMPHGETSCVMLPHILRYNASVNGNRQAVIASAVGSPDMMLADIVSNLVAALGLPVRLRDAGVTESQIGDVATAAVHDPLLASNPRPISSLDVVLELLKQAW